MRFGLFFQAPESAGHSHAELSARCSTSSRSASRWASTWPGWRRSYRAHLEAGGHSWQSDQMALMFPVHVGSTASAARDAMRPGVHQYYRNLQTIFSALPESYGEHLPRLRMIEEIVANLPYERFCRDQGVFGDAAEVLDRLQAAREQFDLSQIICWFDQGSMLPREEVERAMRRFAEHVMPKLV